MFERRLNIACDPIALLERASGMPGAVLLHSGMNAYGLGRYSVFSAFPWKSIGHKDGFLEVVENGKTRRESWDLFDALEAQFEKEQVVGSGDLPFYSGGIGYVAYDAGRYLEKIEGSEGDGYDARFNFYRAAVVFDHEMGDVWLTGFDEESADKLYSKIESKSVEAQEDPFRLVGELSSNFTREEYCEAVDRVKDYIAEGEVYQVNLSQKFEGECRGSSLDLFVRLAKGSSAPYAAYMDFGDEQIISSSPERFLTIGKGIVTTRPIKGTRSAGASDEEAVLNARELSESEKDHSELLMILDLERNDIGRVCQPGTVKVDGLFAIERYATVIHQTAEVSGKMEAGVSVVDCVKALFPGGSITGAPKIRAMEVIAELEKGPRGIYTGAIGYANGAGEADFNIAIRTIRVANERLSFQVGGGIVWDSEPESEYEETLLKGKAMKEAIGNCYEK